jgi:H+/gluconate symporter-like permease
MAEVSPAVDSFAFELATGALYHRSRVSWFAGLHRTGMFLSALAGTAAVASIVKLDQTALLIVGIVLAVISAANLAFDFSGLARKHDEARRRYHDLAAELEEGKKDERNISRLRAKMIRDAATAPVVFEAAEKVVFNAAIRSLGRDPNDEWVLTRSQRALRHIRPYSGTKFSQRKDRAA